MKYFRLFFLPFLSLASCSNKTEIENLKKENQSLRDSIIKLTQQSKDNQYRAIAVSNKSELKLGDEYMADIQLAFANKTNPPKVILCDIENGAVISTGDTLPYNKDYQVSMYRLTPKDTGQFTWSGIVLQNINGKTEQYPFTMKYSVKK